MSNTCIKHPNEAVIFRQLFDHQSFTYTYILADPKTKEAVIIDPVFEKVDRDLEIIKQLGLSLKYALNTHCHADHVTGTGKMKAILPNLKSVISEASKAKADVHLKDGDEIVFGNEKLIALATPGHTDGCMSFVSHSAKCVFTGDTLFIRGCGRTDFQQGNANTLYDSVHSKLFTLGDAYTVFPGHDYKGNTSSTIGEERKYNPRLSKSKVEFVDIMKNLNLDYPKLMDIAVPANLICGLQYDPKLDTKA